MTTNLVDSDTRASIERGLQALGRDKLDEWTDRTMTHLAARDPEPVRAARPEVVEAAERLRNHPLLSVPHCGHFVAFLALAAFSTGVLVIPGVRRKPANERVGGTEDLFVTENPADATGLWPHMDRLFAEGGAVSASYRNIPLFEGAPRSRDAWDPFKRLTFRCETCGAERPIKNVTLLRYFFEAVLRGEDEVRIFRSDSSSQRPKASRPKTVPRTAGAPFEFIPFDEEDAVLLVDVALAGVESGPVDAVIPDAVMAGVDAARAAKQLGCSLLAIQLVHSAARAAALNVDETSWQAARPDLVSIQGDVEVHVAIAELRRANLWPWPETGGDSES